VMGSHAFRSGQRPTRLNASRNSRRSTFLRDMDHICKA